MQRINRAVINPETSTNAVNGVVRIGIAETVVLGHLAVINVQSNPLTGTQEVFLADTQINQYPLGIGISDTRRQIAGRLFLDGKIDVNLITGAGYRRRFHTDFLEIAGTVQTGTGQRNLIG